METITIKIYKPMHDQLKKRHVDDIGEKQKVSPFIGFCDEVLKAGMEKVKRR